MNRKPTPGQRMIDSAKQALAFAEGDAGHGCIVHDLRDIDERAIPKKTEFDRITRNPKQMNGQPCIRGMRLTVRRVVEAVAIYPNPDDLYRNYPSLEPEDIRQAFAFVAANPDTSC